MAAARTDEPNFSVHPAGASSPNRSMHATAKLTGSDAATAVPRWRGDLWTGRVRRYLPMARTVFISLSVYGVFAVQGMLLARLLGPQARGEFATSVFYTQALTYIGLFGAAFAIARQAARSNVNVGGLERSALRLGLATSVATMAVVACLSWMALPAEKRYLAPMCLLCSLYLPFEQMRLTLQAVDHGQGAFGLYNANRLFAAMMFPLLLAAAWWMGWISVGMAACLSVVAPALGLAHRLTYLHAAPSAGSRPQVWPMFREGWPFALSVAVADLFSRMDVLLLVWLATFKVQGYYATAVAAAGMLLVTPTAIALFSFNAGARHSAAQRKPRLLAIATAVLLLQAGTTVAFAAVLPYLMTLVFGAEFAAATPLALALLPAHGLGGCAVVAEGYLRGAGRSGAGVWARLLGIAVMLTFVAVGYGRWQEFSVPYGFAAGQAACALAMLTAILRDRNSQHVSCSLPIGGET